MTNQERAMIKAAVERLGAAETARRLALSVEATLRLAGNFGSQRGTEALALANLHRLGDEPDRAA